MKQVTKFTAKHKKFFSEPKTMQEITDLFNGDIFAANEFQTVNLLGRNIKTITRLAGCPSPLMFVNYDWYDVNEDTAMYAAHC